MKNKIMKAASKLTALAMVASMFAMSAPAGAAEATSRSITFSRLKAVTATNAVLVFTSQQAFGDTEAFTLVNAGSSWDFSSVAFGTTTMSGSSHGSFTLDAACTGADYSVSASATTVTITGCSGGSEIANAETVTVTFSSNSITTGTAGGHTLSLGGVISGDMDVSIVDDDQVSISASIDPTLTFDLDVANTDTESAAAYTVDLGALTTGAVGTSNGGAVPYVWVDISTNATGGAAVSVTGDGDGLKSTSTPADIIPYVSGSGALSAGTAGYGICVGAVGQTAGATLTRAGNFTSTSCDNSTHTVGEVTSSAANILTANNPIDGGRAQIWVKAAIAASTPAHPDYTDVITFLAAAQY